MANVKISDLTGAASASGTQEFEVNDSGTSKKVTGTQLATFIEGEVSSSPTLTGQVSLDNGTNTAPSLTNTGDTNTGLYFPSDDTVGLAAGGGLKLSANASGIDVTGTVTADDINVEGSTPSILLTDTTGPYTHTIQAINQELRIEANDDLRVETNDTQRMRIDGATGDISFYEDTGTTPKFFWDASAESLGIGTSSPATALTVSTDGTEQLTINRADASINTGNTVGTILFTGDDPSANQTGARMQVIASQNWSSNAYGSHITFSNDSSGTLTERMRIDSSGNVGIGTSSPSEKLHVEGDVRLSDNASIQFGSSKYQTLTGQTGSNDLLYRTYANHIFKTITGPSDNTDGSERMRIDSSGNLLVGKATASDISISGVKIQPSGQIVATQDSADVLRLNRKTSDGTIIDLRKDGSTVGSIGARAGGLYIGSTNGSDAFLAFFSNEVAPSAHDGSARDNVIDLGNPSRRFDDIYATNGTIQTSDRNEKQDIEALSDAEQRVAVACKGLLRKFRWIDAVAEKGDDARIHFGIIAQDLQNAFAAEGLDAGRYAMFISSTWTDEETGEERTRMGVRYPELLAFIIAAI